MQFVKLPIDILSDKKLGSSPKLVYAYLLDLQGNNGRAWPSISAIAKACGIARNAALRAVWALQKANKVIIDQRKGRNPIFSVLVPKEDHTRPTTELPPVPERGLTTRYQGELF